MARGCGGWSVFEEKPDGTLDTIAIIRSGCGKQGQLMAAAPSMRALLVEIANHYDLEPEHDEAITRLVNATEQRSADG